MGSCRILHNAHPSQLVSWEPVQIISKAYNSILVSHIILLLFNSSSLFSCRLVAIRSCHCVLSLDWLEGLLHNCTITEDQGDLQAMGNSTTFISRPSKKYCPSRLPSQHPREFQGDVFSFPPFRSMLNPVPMHIRGPNSNGSWAIPHALPSRS